MMFLSTVKIAHFTLRKSNLAPQRIFCTLQPCVQNQQAAPVSPSIEPENKQLMSNVSAWMRCKADLVHGWTIQPFTFRSIAYLKKQWDREAPWESRGRSAAAALWLPSPTRQIVKLKAAFKPVALKHDLQNELFKIVAWMLTGKGFKDEFLLSIKLKCLAAL